MQGPAEMLFSFPEIKSRIVDQVNGEEFPESGQIRIKNNTHLFNQENHLITGETNL